MSSLGSVGLQLASLAALTYPQDLCFTTYAAAYQPLTGAASTGTGTGTGTGGARLTSIWSTFKHHVLTSPQGAFEVYRGILSYLGYVVVYTAGYEVVRPVSGGLVHVAAWRFVLAPLTGALYRVQVSPVARGERPIVPNVRALWAIVRPRGAQWLDWRLGALEAAHALVSAATNLAFSHAARPLLPLFAPHFPTPPRPASHTALAIALTAAGRLAALAIHTLAVRLAAQLPPTPPKHPHSASYLPLRPSPYSGIRDALSSIVREEGPAALIRGWGYELVSNLALATVSAALAAQLLYN